MKCVDGSGRVIYTELSSCAEAFRAAPTPKYGNPALNDRARSYLIKHPDINPAYKTAIELSLVIPGMTEEQVRASMGEPNQMNLTQTKYSSRWQWVYTKNGRSKYVYLEDGVVTGTN